MSVISQNEIDLGSFEHDEKQSLYHVKDKYDEVLKEIERQSSGNPKQEESPKPNLFNKMISSKGMNIKKQKGVQMKFLQKFISKNIEKQLEKNGKNKKLAGIEAVKAQTNKSQAKKLSKSNMNSQMSLEVFDNDDFQKELNFSVNNQSSLNQAPLTKAQKKKDLRAIFIKNYGVQMEIPAYYFYDARFVPHYKDHVVTMAFHIIPKKQMFQNNVQTTFIDGKVEENSFDEIYDQTGTNIILNLFQSNGRQGFKKIREIVLEEVHASIMQFSKSGNHFAIFVKGQEDFYVYESTDINKCFDDIKNKLPLFKTKIKDPNFGQAYKITFDIHDKFVAISSMTQILIFSLEKTTKEINRLLQGYQIDVLKFSGILDVVIDSDVNFDNSIDGRENVGEYPYSCQIACKFNGVTSIHFFDINESHDVRTISYMKNIGEIVVKLSDDFQTAIFSNGKENYLLKGRGQEYFAAIKDKFLRYVVSHNNQFYLVTSKDYDRDIDILSSSNRDFNASILRSIEPGILKVFDSIIDTNVESPQGQLKTLVQLGDYLYIDTIDIAKCFDSDPLEAVIDSVVEKHYHAQGFNWPYFSYGTKDNYVFILNAFNPSFIQRYQLPEKVSIISHTFLTDTHDFYVFVETSDEHFEIYTIDLDSPYPLVVGPILRYSFEKVSSFPAKGFHVRGSSRKEKINLNKQLMCFMMHGTDLWGWTGSDIKLISKTASNLYYLSDDQVFFLYTSEKPLIVGDREVEHSKVQMIDCLYGSYKINPIYEDIDQRAEILNYGVDNTRRRLIVLTGIKNNHNKRDKFFSIYDIDTEKVLYQLQIRDREIIGRLKSNLYNFTEGHIYYNNKVIKIRYDIIKSRGASEIKEQELFDHYDNVINLQNQNDLVQSGTPLQTCLYNRLAYLIKNVKQLQTNRVLILPYLHERRIYLNRRHEANHFYTIYEHDGMPFILCLCINENKLYIYTETGILCDRVIYDEVAEKCGKPEAVSQDGCNFLFKKSNQSYEFHMLKMHVKGFDIKQSMNIKEKLQAYLNKEVTSKKQRQKLDLERIIDTKNDKKIEDMMYYWINFLDQLNDLKQIQFTYCVNDSGDLLVRIQPNPESIKQKKRQIKSIQEFVDEEETKMKESILSCSFFYYIPSIESSKREFLYFDSQADELYDLQGCSMNTGYMFFWNLGVVWSLNLETQVIKRLNIYISEEDKQTYVKAVRCWSNQDRIVIRVTQSSIKDCIIYWDLIEQREIDSFDIDTESLTFQDKSGSLFIIERDRIYCCASGCKLRCYQVQLTDFDMQNAKFTFYFGYRIDQNTNNWIIFRNYINLSFSYMTFVIKDNFERNNFAIDDYCFDMEGYDFVINRQTIFTDDNGSLLQQDFQKMSFIMKNYLNYDKDYLESLHYKNDQNKIPLHYALAANNNRMVNLILYYMAKIDYSAAHVIQDIFKDLINFQKFEYYLKECPFKTKQMTNKQTLKLLRTRAEADEQDILVCTPSQCSYIDDVYFKEQMGEDPDNRSCLTFAVDVKCVRADWIIQKKEGLLFLKELLRQQNKDVFMTPYIMIVIQFLYQKYSASIMTRLMPPFLMHLLAVIFLIFLSELERDNLFSNDADKHEEKTEEQQNFIKVQKNLVQIIATILNMVNLIIFGIQTYYLRWMQFKRFWAYLDFTILMANIIIACSLFKEMDVLKLRIFEAILIVVMMLKSLYFLRLIGEIAPLIDIIFSIIHEIRYFMAIYIIALVSFICAFYSIGRNQAQLAGDDQDLIPEYATYLGAFKHVYTSSLGQLNTDSYYDNQMTTICVVLFLLMSFFMCILLLNMLIAIMGDIFANNQDTKEAKKKMSELAFVVENWWIDPIKNKDQIMYLIAAFKIEEENDNEEQRFQIIMDQMEYLFKMQDNLMAEAKNLQFQVAQNNNQ